MKEALKLALEALEFVNQTGDTQTFDMCYADKAITAIKEALAQPEQDYPEDFIHALAFHTALSDLEPEQEPAVDKGFPWTQKHSVTTQMYAAMPSNIPPHSAHGLG